MTSHAQFEQWVPAPLEPVFLFFANPQNLPRIMPPQTGTRLEELRLVPPQQNPAVTLCEGLAGIGSEILTSFRLFSFLPVRARWTALVVEFEWNHHFADIQKKGPFQRFHHRHEFAAQTRDGRVGTIVRDVIEYEVGFGWLGSIADRWQVRPELERTFRHRQQVLPGLLGVGD